MNKIHALLLILTLAASSFFMIKPIDAQTPLPSYIPEPSYPIPSIPEFNVELTGPSFTQPTTYILNESTGQIEAQIGFTNEYSSVQIIVKNQPFTFFDGLHGPVSLMYNVRMKLHQNSDEWSEVYTADNGYPSQNSEGSITNLNFTIQFVRGLGSIAGSQIDIQVQAMIGTVQRTSRFASWFLDGQVSGWSNTETISVSANTPLNAPSSSPPSNGTTVLPTSVSNPDSPLLLNIITISVVIIALLLTLLAYLLFYIRKKKIN